MSTTNALMLCRAGKKYKTDVKKPAHAQCCRQLFTLLPYSFKLKSKICLSIHVSIYLQAYGQAFRYKLHTLYTILNLTNENNLEHFF